MDVATLLWMTVPLAAVHVGLRRNRAALAFQLLLDLAMVALVGLPLTRGLHLGPGVVGGEQWGAPVTVSGSPEQSDLPLQFHVWWSEAQRLAAEGEMPWISDRIGGGAPLFANGQSGLPFPLQASVWVLGPERGTDVMAIWKLELAALGGFFLLRRLRAGPAAAALAGLAYGLGLYQLSWLVVPLAWVVAAAPWVWWTLIGTLRGSRASGALLALLLGMLAGWSVHPESAAFLWLAVALGGLVLAWGRWRRVARLAAPLALALLVSGVGAVTMIPAIADSGKYASLRATPAYPSTDATWPMRLRAMALVVMPWREGWPADGSWRAPFPAAPLAVSVGSVALVVALTGLPRRRHRRHAVAISAVGGAAALMVWQIPGAAQFLVRLPVIGVLTWSRAGFLISFALAVLGGLASDAWLRRPRRRRFLVAALVLQGLVLAMLLGVSSPTVRRTALRTAWLPGLLACATPVVSVAGGWLLPSAVLAEQVMLGRWLVPVSRPGVAVEQPEIAKRLRGALEREGGRVLGLGAALPPNLAARWGARDLRSHDPMRPGDLVALHQALGAPGTDLPGPIACPWAGLAGAWGVRWLVTDVSGLPGELSSGWEQIYAGPDGRLYRNLRALPVVRLATREAPVPGDAAFGTWESIDFGTTAIASAPVPLGGSGTLEVLTNEPSRWRARVHASGPVVAVLHVPWAPGWAARLDDLGTPLVRVNLAAMGVLVPAGDHVVEWRYRPVGIALGSALSTLGLVGCGMLALAGRRRRG